MKPHFVLLAVCFACAAAPAPEAPGDTASVEVHPRFSVLRPVMVQLRVDGQGGGVDELREGLYRGLIAKGYSVLAPGAVAGSDVGIFRARLLGGGESRSVEASLEDPFGTVLYRYASSLEAGALEIGAPADVLRRLPPK